MALRPNLMRYCSIALTLNLIGLCVLSLLFISAEMLRPYYGAIEITQLERGQAFNEENLRENFPEFAGDRSGGLGRFVTANLFAVLRIVFAVAITTLVLSSYFLLRHLRHLKSNRGAMNAGSEALSA
jgi:hypothetical protein